MADILQIKTKKLL